MLWWGYASTNVHIQNAAISVLLYIATGGASCLYGIASLLLQLSMLRIGWDALIAT